jgi:hypothetical protein
VELWHERSSGNWRLLPKNRATVRRWQALTGGSARHAASGRSFDDVAREGEAANAA